MCLPVLAAVLILALTLSACSGSGRKNGTDQKTRVLGPKVRTEFKVDDWASADSLDETISPDGKNALLKVWSENGQALIVASLEGGQTPKVLYSVPREWTDLYALSFRTLGWGKDGNPLFIAFGYQSQGPNKDKRGIAVLSGDLSSGTSRELAFMDLPKGELHLAQYLKANNKVYMTVSGAIWTYDLNSEKLSQVKIGLPTYDGLFFPRLSPDGAHFAYDLLEQGRRGVYVLDASSGAEKVLLPNGDTMSFLPQWSPDGKYLAAYTVQRKAGETGADFDAYDYFAGEDGPMPIAPAITVVDAAGRIVRTLSLEGKQLSSFRWSVDSATLAFVSGQRLSSDSGFCLDCGLSAVRWDGIWTAAAAGNDKPVRLAALESSSKEPSFIYPLSFDADNKGVYYQFSQGQNLAVFYARPGAGAGETPLPPAKIADGHWHFQAMNPVFQKYTGALITGGSQTELWFLGPEFRKMDAWGTVTTEIVGYNADTILLFRRGENKPSTITVVSVYDE